MFPKTYSWDVSKAKTNNIEITSAKKNTIDFRRFGILIFSVCVNSIIGMKNMIADTAATPVSNLQKQIADSIKNNKK